MSVNDGCNNEIYFDECNNKFKGGIKSLCFLPYSLQEIESMSQEELLANIEKHQVALDKKLADDIINKVAKPHTINFKMEYTKEDSERMDAFKESLMKNAHMIDIQNQRCLTHNCHLSKCFQA